VPTVSASGIEHVFREEYGRAVAVLVRVFGDIDIAEEAVQDAFTAAVQSWPASGLPPSPAGWIITTARNRAIDRLRREASREDRHAQAALLHACDETAEEGAVRDDRLRRHRQRRLQEGEVGRRGADAQSGKELVALHPLIAGRLHAANPEHAAIRRQQGVDQRRRVDAGRRQDLHGAAGNRGPSGRQDLVVLPRRSELDLKEGARHEGDIAARGGCDMQDADGIAGRHGAAAAGHDAADRAIAAERRAVLDPGSSRRLHWLGRAERCRQDDAPEDADRRAGAR